MVYLGGISLHDLFCLPIGNTLSPYCMTSVELLSVMDILLQRIFDSNMLISGISIIGTMDTIDYAQIQPVDGCPFLLYFCTIICFKMVMIKISIR